MIKEISPIITVLICACRIGTELGFMGVPKQINAVEVFNTNPFKYLVVTQI